MKRALALSAVLFLAVNVSVFADSGPATPDSFSSKDMESMSFLTRAPNVLVPGYRVWFIVQDGATARAEEGGGAKASAGIVLRGVDEAVMQDIADQALSDFMDQLKKTGRTVYGPADIQSDAAWKDFETVANPQYDEGKKGKLGYMIFSPKVVPLWVEHFDKFGGASPFNQKTDKALYSICTNRKAVALQPNVIVRFANVAGSGHHGGRRAAVSVEPWMAIQDKSTVQLWIGSGGGETVHMNTGILLDSSIGDVVEVGEKKGGTYMGDGMTAWKSVTAGYEYDVDAAKYKSEVLKGIHAFNRGVAEAVASTK